MDQQTVNLLTYTGKGLELSNLEHEICGHDADQGLYKSLHETEEQPNEPAPLANVESVDEKKNYKAPKDAYEKEIADIKKKRNKSCAI